MAIVGLAGRKRHRIVPPLPVVHNRRRARGCTIRAELRAFLSDAAQRLLTLNKLAEKQSLSSWLDRLMLPPGARLLDFGCGTGLFAPMLHGAGFRYVGYDPDPAVVAYASRRYHGPTFISQLEDAAAVAPFDVVLANCCFHHISDDELRDATLPAIAAMMHRASTFMLLDVLPLESGASAIRRLYNLFEQGARKRTPAELDRLLAGHFTVRSRRVRRSFLLSAAAAANPIYNDVVEFELALR
jgi:SAM-dependent methyltransferase